MTKTDTFKLVIAILVNCYIFKTILTIVARYTRQKTFGKVPIHTDNNDEFESVIFGTKFVMSEARLKFYITRRRGGISTRWRHVLETANHRPATMPPANGSPALMPAVSRRRCFEKFAASVPHAFARCLIKTRLQFCFKSNGIWSWWQFSSRFCTKLKSIWFKGKILIPIMFY